MAFLASVVEALIPPWPKLPGGRAEEVRAGVVSTVRQHAQLAPAHLRAVLALVGIMFRLYALLVSGRPFGFLPLHRRRKILGRWEAMASPCRAYVRFYRFLTLLAHFENPVVLEALGCPPRESWRREKIFYRASLLR